MEIYQQEIEEYLWLGEYIQGNVNVAGLMFDDLVVDGLTLGPEDVLTVFVEQLAEELGIGEDFNPYHLEFMTETITFRELFGSPLRVRQSVLNLAMRDPLIPALIANVHLDVLHGVDIYWEDVSSELQAHSSYVNAVPYWWEWVYESFWIDLTEADPLPPIILRLMILTTDLVNMRHEVTQEYLFNSKCFEQFFIWDQEMWGWSHLLEDEVSLTSWVNHILGFNLSDYLFWSTGLDMYGKVTHALAERMLVYDKAVDERFYLLLAESTFAITDGEVQYVGVDYRTLAETIGISGVAASAGVLSGLAMESVTFADITAFVNELIIEDGLAMGDVELERWVINVMVESVCSITDIIG